MKKSKGTIFLSKFSMQMIRGNSYSALVKADKVIYHVVDKMFFNNNKKYIDLNIKRETIKILYVSIINYYKIHINVLNP